MKKFIPLFVLIILLFPISSYAKTLEELKDVWYETGYYPIYYGNDEWQKHGIVETNDAWNPPFDYLFSLTSDKLAELLLDYPFMMQVHSFRIESDSYDYSQIWAYIESHCYIFYELLRREDGIMSILKAYENSLFDYDFYIGETWHDWDNNFDAMCTYYAEINIYHFVEIYFDCFSESERVYAEEILNKKRGYYDKIKSKFPLLTEFDEFLLPEYSEKYKDKVPYHFVSTDQIEEEFENAINQIEEEKLLSSFEVQTESVVDVLDDSEINEYISKQNNENNVGLNILAIVSVIILSISTVITYKRAG